MVKSFAVGLIFVCLLFTGCVTENSTDPWKGNLYLDAEGNVRSLDPTKEKLYASQRSEELDEVMRKMPYKVKLPTYLPMTVTRIWAHIELVGTQNFDGVNKLGNDQGLDIMYVNAEKNEAFGFKANRLKWDLYLEGFQQSDTLENGSETWFHKHDSGGGTLRWKEDNINYQLSGLFPEEEFIKVANALEYAK